MPQPPEPRFGLPPGLLDLVAHQLASGADLVEALEVAARGVEIGLGLLPPTRRQRAQAQQHAELIGKWRACIQALVNTGTWSTAFGQAFEVPAHTVAMWHRAERSGCLDRVLSMLDPPDRWQIRRDQAATADGWCERCLDQAIAGGVDELQLALGCRRLAAIAYCFTPAGARACTATTWQHLDVADAAAAWQAVTQRLAVLLGWTAVPGRAAHEAPELPASGPGIPPLYTGRAAGNGGERGAWLPVTPGETDPVGECAWVFSTERPEPQRRLLTLGIRRLVADPEAADRWQDWLFYG